MTLVVFEGGSWWRLTDTLVAERGASIDALLRAPDERVVSIVPARVVSVQSATLPGLADAQARAAARLLVAETSMTPVDGLHVATGIADANGQRTVAAIEATTMARHLAELATIDIDPDQVLPATTLLPRPALGFVRGVVAGETIVRGAELGFADDPVLTPLLVGEGPLEEVDDAAIERAMVAALLYPEVDLRQGVFAKRRRWIFEALHLRRIAALAATLLLLSIAIALIALIKLNATAARVERENLVRATAILPPGTVVTDPATQVAARLVAVRGPGGGFAPLAAVVAEAANTTPGVELSALVFEGEGGLRATVRAATSAELQTFEAQLLSGGLAVVSGPIASNQGRPYRDLTVRAP